MWKLIVAFVLFAAAALYMLSKGPEIDMSGEKHGIDAHDTAASAAHAAPAASAAVEAASAAVEPASAASR